MLGVYGVRISMEKQRETEMEAATGNTAGICRCYIVTREKKTEPTI